MKVGSALRYAGVVAAALGLTAVQIERVFRDIDAKRKMARYLHSPPITLPLPKG